LLTAKGRLGGFYARTGRTEPAIAIFREILAANETSGTGATAPRRVLDPFFELLLGQGGSVSQETAAEIFRASQLLVRPGVAQTQAVLARELSGGSDEAAGLFRQSVSLNRDAERLRVQIARLRERDDAAPELQQRQAELEQIQTQQVATQAGLAQFPRYRAVTSSTIPLADLQAQLRPGEAYYKMMVLDEHSYGVLVTNAAVQAFRLGASPQELEWQVDAVRNTISTIEGREIVTLPFDVETAHNLYRVLFQPIEAQLSQIGHLIFEPDGAMLRLPPNLLVMDRQSIETYRARASRPDDDGFDFRGVAWLGRDRDISTAVSPRSFVDLRQSAPSRAQAQYIGFGQHKPTDSFFLPAASLTRGGGDGCDWSLAAWGRPISAAELKAARGVLGGTGAEVVTGAAFNDAAIRARSDLDQYRIVHFATHGLLQPPRRGCPAKPALMTSFGASGSDGLLSFGEIFDLRLDADVIILSACDTAGGASIAANREAGISGGGDFALDGLVRAFVGAGSRMVVASHWPVPDDFNATQRLISGLFTAPAGSGTAAALRTAQKGLMDDALTSHPFYWSGFAVVGDGAQPLLRPTATQTAGLN
jgi:CHAT domain-containing protein